MTTPGWVFYSAILLGGASLSVWALFWDRHRGRRRCPKCWYDMSGAPERRCPECGHAARQPKHLQRTRRRWKAAGAALLITAGVAVAPFWNTLLVRYRSYLPNTVLILFQGRVTPHDPAHRWAFHAELRGRLEESPALCVERWNRAALWRWQWKLLAAGDEPELDDLRSVAELFAQAPLEQPPLVTHEQMLALDHDDLGRRFAELNQLILWPVDTFLPGYESHLSVKWLDINASDGRPARIYLVSSMQRFWLFATRQVDDDWRFAGAYNIWSKYADPDIRLLDEDQTICELASISTGGTGSLLTATVWWRIDERGLRVVHEYFPDGHQYWGGGAFNFAVHCTASTTGMDERGGFIDHAIHVSIDNSDVGWNELSGTAADRESVAELAEVFTRQGIARYRWDAKKNCYLLSEHESDWRESQLRGQPYGYESDALFITQNFDTLVDLATGEDAARRAWVRLALTRLQDSQAKDRLIKAMANRRRN